MSNLAKAIRHKRFDVKHDVKVTLHLQSPTGTMHALHLVNCSLMGLGATCETPLALEDGFLEGHVLPPAKLTWDDKEVYLGRLVMRTTRSENGVPYYGFQTIDAKVPIDGVLSRALAPQVTDSQTVYDFELDPEKFNLASFLGSEQSNVDLFARCKQFAILYKKWKESPKYQYRTVREPSKGPRVTTNQARKGGRNDFIIMGSNDYLGLASHPRVIEAAKKALDLYGFGATGSPVTTGMSRVHEELADHVARALGKEKAMLFNSGYIANVGIINGLAGELDLVTADVLSHASIQDAMQMAKATGRFFRHNDVAHLDKLLDESRGKFAGSLVVTEGVFSMDGDVAPVDKICAVARKHNSRVMVDEAHSFGVVGPGGLGAAAKFNKLGEVDVVMGTFSKICGGIGGFVAADADVIEWLYHFARAHLFTVSLPPSTAAAALEAVKIWQEDKSLVERLHANIRHFVKGLSDLGFDVNPQHESAVIPVTIGDERILGIMNQSLRDDGVFVVPIVYPAVSRSGCRFRFTVMSAHTTSDLDYVLGAVEKAILKANFQPQAVKENLLKLRTGKNDRAA